MPFSSLFRCSPGRCRPRPASAAGRADHYVIQLTGRAFAGQVEPGLKRPALPRIVLALIGWQTCGRHPARWQSWPGPGRRRTGRESLPGSLATTALRPCRTRIRPSAANASRAALMTPVPMPARSSVRRSMAAHYRGEAAGLDGLGEHIGDLLGGRAAVASVNHQGRDVAVLDERPPGAGQVAAALYGVQLVEDGAADLPHLQVPEGRLDGAADEPLLVCRVDTSHGATSAYSSRSVATVAADSGVGPQRHLQ